MRCLRSDYLTQGPILPEFEQQIAAACQAPHAVAFNSATSALHAACLALGLSPGDYLWTSPISFVASSNCALYCGASVDFVDIEPTTGLISISSLKTRLAEAEKNGTLPKVLVPVHLAGTSCQMMELAQLSRDYGFSILEDASHAIGASYKGMPVGNCDYSSITVFSFHPVKIITTGEGGAALTKNPLLAQSLSLYRSHGIERLDFEYESPGPWYYEQQALGFNYRMTEIQASLGLSQINRLSRIVDTRQELVSTYRQLLQDLPVDLLDQPLDCRSSYHLAIVSIRNINPLQHRKVFEGMRAAGIGVQLHYWPIHLQPYYRKLGFVPGQFPFAEAYAQSSFSLPLFPGLSTSDQERVVSELKRLIIESNLL